MRKEKASHISNFSSELASLLPFVHHLLNVARYAQLQGHKDSEDVLSDPRNSPQMRGSRYLNDYYTTGR